MLAKNESIEVLLHVGMYVINKQADFKLYNGRVVYESLLQIQTERTVRIWRICQISMFARYLAPT